MKKIIIAVLALTLTFSMTGCDKLTELNLNETTETTNYYLHGSQILTQITKDVEGTVTKRLDFIYLD